MPANTGGIAMELLKTLMPLLETGLKLYVSSQFIKKTSQRTRAAAIRGGIFLFGIGVLLLFLLIALVMTFVDLGHQFEGHNGIHLSGMMVSSFFLFSLGVLVFGVCYGAMKYLEGQEKIRKNEERNEVGHYAPLVLAVEELIKHLKVSEARGS